MSDKYHVGEGYTDVQQAELDRLFSEMLEWTYRACLNRWTNEPLNIKANSAEAAYDAKKAEFDEWKESTFGDNDPGAFSTYFNEAR